MKKFLYLLALPLLITMGIIIFLIIGVQTDGFQSERDTSFYKYCIHKGYADNSPVELGNCVEEYSSRYGRFINAINRAALEDNDFMKGDRGGCDFIALREFHFNDPVKDRQDRLRYILNCQDNGAINLYEMITDKKFIPNGAAADQNVTYLPMAKYYASCENYQATSYIIPASFDRQVEVTCNYLKTAYAQKLAKSFDGQTIREIIKNPEYEMKTYDVFSPFILLLALSPILLIGFLTYKYKENLLPTKGENITSWLESQKKFRISLLLSLFWALAFVLTVVIGEPDKELLIFLIALALYPLTVFLSVRFIVLSKD